MVSASGNAYPKGVEELDIDGLKVIGEVDTMDNAFGVDLEEAEHEVSQSRDESKGDHIDPAEHYIGEG